MEAPVRVSQEFNCSVQELWTALTNKEDMVQWFFENIPAFEPKVGFKTQFNVKAPSRDFMHLWEILEVVPMEKIVYRWHYQDIEGEGKVVFSVTPTTKGSKLELENYGLESFPSSYPEFTMESCLGGWNYFIKERLNGYLNQK